MGHNVFRKPLVLITAGAMWCAPFALQAEEIQTLTDQNVISGTMNITFNTRTQLDNSGKFAENSPKLGIKDVYDINLSVAQTTEFNGKIERQPRVKIKLVGMEAQAGALFYDVDLAVLNPNNLSQKKKIGKWVGSAPAEVGVNSYSLDGGKALGSPLRMAVDTVGAVQGFSDEFGGQLIGKPDKSEGWKEKLTAFTFERTIGNKKVKIQAAKTNPVQFKNIKLAKGPLAIYPSTTVNGNMVYDYETSNWYVSGIRFKYNVNGKDYEDVVSGSIKWVEENNRADTGLGYYDLNLRFNEEQQTSASTEADAFSNMSDEEALFAVDTSIPALTGRIDFKDTFIPGAPELMPSASTITYGLHANKLTKQQIMNFFKLWMLAVGPVNDE